MQIQACALAFSPAAATYPVYYNVDQGTAGEGGIPREPYPPIQVDVTQFGLMSLNYTQGERACILPGCTPWKNGAFPLLECSSSGKIVKTYNGGVPQLANLSLHLELIRQTLPEWIPDPDWSVRHLFVDPSYYSAPQLMRSILHTILPPNSCVRLS
jgi:hypothetical protein